MGKLSLVNVVQAGISALAGPLSGDAVFPADDTHTPNFTPPACCVAPLDALNTSRFWCRVRVTAQVGAPQGVDQETQTDFAGVDAVFSTHCPAHCATTHKGHTHSTLSAVAEEVCEPQQTQSAIKQSTSVTETGGEATETDNSVTEVATEIEREALGEKRVKSVETQTVGETASGEETETETAAGEMTTAETQTPAEQNTEPITAEGETQASTPETQAVSAETQAVGTETQAVGTETQAVSAEILATGSQSAEAALGAQQSDSKLMVLTPCTCQQKTNKVENFTDSRWLSQLESSDAARSDDSLDLIVDSSSSANDPLASKFSTSVNVSSSSSEGAFKGEAPETIAFSVSTPPHTAATHTPTHTPPESPAAAQSAGGDAESRSLGVPNPVDAFFQETMTSSTEAFKKFFEKMEHMMSTMTQTNKHTVKAHVEWASEHSGGARPSPWTQPTLTQLQAAPTPETAHKFFFEALGSFLPLKGVPTSYKCKSEMNKIYHQQVPAQ
eukprot:Gregarina_sp_Pseudo_9__5666@NODE_7_length_7070_cov_43_502062_g5_i0_p3_GENE_NODE_7_length_7070_cov_43_502062_g5_i0NODE_7_length_7070_cov_43_502062_g5_i0_p3_ORF_typecomplete_len501_score97_84Fer4_12/PF13353_6/0_28Thioredoxin_16/PF18569_1/0_76Thioredoxin_16/PF18569_1/2_2e03_NODE_7_length_7070_cov_43_502062_g5_i01791681